MAESVEASESSTTSNKSTPKTELALALLLAVPCLAYVVSQPYLLYYNFEPIVDGGSSNNGSFNNVAHHETRHFMDKTVFTDFVFDADQRKAKEEGVQVLQRKFHSQTLFLLLVYE